MSSTHSTPVMTNRPFTPGYIPPRDITNSPVARSIAYPYGRPVPPRGDLDLYPFPASEPILEVIRPPQQHPGRGRSSSQSTSGSRTVGRRTRTPSPYAGAAGVGFGHGRGVSGGGAGAASTSNNSSPGPPGLGIGGVRWGFEDRTGIAASASASTDGPRRVSLGAAPSDRGSLFPPTGSSTPTSSSSTPAGIRGATSGVREASPLRRSSVSGPDGHGGEAMARSSSAPGGPSGGVRNGANPPSALRGVSPAAAARMASAPEGKPMKDVHTQTPTSAQTGFPPPPATAPSTSSADNNNDNDMKPENGKKDDAAATPATGTDTTASTVVGAKNEEAAAGDQDSIDVYHDAITGETPLRPDRSD